MKNRNIDLKALVAKLKNLEKALLNHLLFIVTLAVLLVYLFVVWQIRALATAEPSPDAETEALTQAKVPRIDQKTIDKIQSLENNSPQIQALFNNARNNPFHE